MPIPQNIRLQLSVNGAAQQTGGITVTSGQSVQPSAVDTTGVRISLYELHEYPAGFSCPSGWSIDAGGVYYVTTAGGALPPPVVPDVWGKYLLRLTVNDALRGSGDPAPDLIDDSTAFRILSPQLGLDDVAFGERAQFDPRRQYVAAIKQALRTVENGNADPTNASNAAFLRALKNPFIQPSVIVYDGAHIWVMNSAAAPSVTESTQSIPGGVVKVDPATARVLDAGYYSTFRSQGIFSSDLFSGLAWTGSKLFGLTINQALAYTTLVEIGRSPISFTERYRQSGSLFCLISVTGLTNFTDSLFAAANGTQLVEFLSASPGSVHSTTATGGGSTAISDIVFDAGSTSLFYVDSGGYVGRFDLSGSAPAFGSAVAVTAPQYIACGGNAVYVTATNQLIHRYTTALGSHTSADLSATFDALRAVSYSVETGKIYVTGKPAGGVGGAVSVARLHATTLAVEHVTALHTVTDGGTWTYLPLRGAFTTGKHWVANVNLFTLDATGGEVSSLDITNSSNPATLVTSPTLVRWV